MTHDQVAEDGGARHRHLRHRAGRAARPTRPARARPARPRHRRPLREPPQQLAVPRPPRRPALATENFRSQLVALGIAPNQARKAAMFQLAAEMPAPVLADLLGLSATTASRWASLAARDWSQYAGMRRAANAAQ